MKSSLLEQVSYFKVISTILFIFHLHISTAREIGFTRDMISLENIVIAGKFFHFLNNDLPSFNSYDGFVPIKFNYFTINSVIVFSI